MSLLLLLLACTPAPTPEPAPEPAPPAVEESAAIEVAEVSVPADPARASFTGQATDQGMGLYCALYPLGWSESGQLAWAFERRASDMELSYRADWSLLDTATGETEVHTYSDEDPDQVLSKVWASQQAEVDALLAGVHGPAPELRPFPTTTPWGELAVAWTVEPSAKGHERDVALTLTSSQGWTQIVWKGTVEDLTLPMREPALVLSPDQQHAVVVVEVVEGVVEALADVRWHLIPLQPAER